MILTKHEHACLELEKEGARLVVDPGLFAAPFEAPGLVAVVVTHEHADHVTPEHLDRLLAASPGAALFAPAGVAAAHPGYDWQVVAAGDAREAGPFRLAFSGGRHAVIHASIPVMCILPMTATARLRPIVAISPRFLYRNGTRERPSNERTTFFAHVTPPWIAT